MFSHAHMPDWHSNYSFLPIIYCNVFVLSLSVNLNLSSYEDQGFYMIKMIASIFTGILCDYFSTKWCLVGVLVVGIIGGMWSTWVLGAIYASNQVIVLVYVAEVISDNCKLIALGEVVALQFIGGSIGSILNTFIGDFKLFRLFVLGNSFVMAIFVIALFEEISLDKRPNISQVNAAGYPNIIGVLICLVLLGGIEILSGLVQVNLLHDYYNGMSFVPYIISLLLVPLSLYYVIALSQERDLNKVINLLLLLGLLGWVCQISNMLFYLVFITTLVSASAIKCSSLLLLSRVLGPFYYGKFFGLGLAIQNLVLLIPDSFWANFIIGMSIYIINIVSINLSHKHCETHKDYVISYNTNPQKKFFIKLEKASAVNTEP